MHSRRHAASSRSRTASFFSALGSRGPFGHGSHADPAGGLAPELARLAQDRPVIAHVCGTPGDPQDSQRQVQTLRDAGVVVAPTNAAAARLAARALA